MTCSSRSCDSDAVSTVRGPGGRRDPVCFEHERERVDRQGLADADPRPVARWSGTVADAVSGLRGY